MSTINLAAVLAVAMDATSDSDSVASEIEGSPFAEAFVAAQAEEAEEHKKALTGTIRLALTAHRTRIDQHRVEVRRLNSAIKREKSNMDRLDRAKLYALQTGNLLPLLVLTRPAGFDAWEAQRAAGDDWHRLCTVPEDWQPKSEG